MNFWNTIVQTNTFNFAILLIIFALLYRKLNVSQMIENIKNGIIQVINNAEQEKLNANNKLKNAQNAVNNLDNEINEKLENAKSQAQGVSEKIKNDTQNTVSTLKQNVLKVIESEEKTISNDLSQAALNQSVDLAQKHIMNILKKDMTLHDKLIEECIREI